MGMFVQPEAFVIEREIVLIFCATHSSVIWFDIFPCKIGKKNKMNGFSLIENFDFQWEG